MKNMVSICCLFLQFFSFISIDTFFYADQKYNGTMCTAILFHTDIANI